MQCHQWNGNHFSFHRELCNLLVWREWIDSYFAVSHNQCNLLESRFDSARWPSMPTQPHYAEDTKKKSQPCNAIDTLIGRMTDGQRVHHTAHTKLFSGIEAFKRSNCAYGNHLIRSQRTVQHTLLIQFNPNPNTREVNIFFYSLLVGCPLLDELSVIEKKNRITRLHIRFGSGDDGV